MATPLSDSIRREAAEREQAERERARVERERVVRRRRLNLADVREHGWRQLPPSDR